MGALHDLTIEVRSPRTTVPITNTLVAGGYYALAFGGRRTAYASPDVPAPEDTHAARTGALTTHYAMSWQDSGGWGRGGSPGFG